MRDLLLPLTVLTVPLAATTCTEQIFEAFLADTVDKGLFHAHTYTANPVLCAAALASLRLLATEEIQNNIQRIMQQHKAFAARIEAHPNVKKVDHCGVIFSLELASEMNRYGNKRDEMVAHFKADGILLRPLGNTIYILPPYVISEAQLEQVYESIESAIEKF